MLDLLKGIFGEKVDLQDLINNGATIVDVRTKDEYRLGHIKNSVNIPLDKLGNSLGKLDKNKPVITCCASGMRSASAKSILKANGFDNVHNGGAWTSLKKFKV